MARKQTEAQKLLLAGATKIEKRESRNIHGFNEALTRGVWDDEPDIVEFTTRAGLPGRVRRNYAGALCGYVGVTKEHPFYMLDHQAIDIAVHGRLTFDGRRGKADTDTWWFGFDCNHLGDLAPHKEFHRMPEDVYRPLPYVLEEIEKLAEALHNATGAEK